MKSVPTEKVIDARRDRLSVDRPDSKPARRDAERDADRDAPRARLFPPEALLKPS
tara:strand:- start:237 stop:401 length:165 start_codon:yes stop_codon:yes gene_type:complete